jgi:hypothetical protein
MVVRTQSRAHFPVGLVVAMVLSACGGTNPSARASPTPTPRPTATSSALPSSPIPSPMPVSPTLRFAALTANVNPGVWDHVVIAGLDGMIYNQTSFEPLPAPDTGCGGTALLPPAAFVASGRVYFADGTGAIRSLGISGPSSTVAQFPLTSTQQLMSFAVSPDGTQVLATIFTLPPAVTGGEICRGEPATGDSNYYYDVYIATAAQSAHRVSHRTFPAHSFPNHLALPAIEFDGWNAQGPFGSDPSGFAAGGFIPTCVGLCRWLLAASGAIWFVDPQTGTPTRVADSQCRVYDVLTSGTYLCQDNNQRFYVKASTGAWQWTVGCAFDSGGLLTCFNNGGFLAPDAAHVAALLAHHDDPGATTIVLGQDQSRVQLGDQFVPDGWFDSTTVAVDSSSNLEYINLSAPTVVNEIGITGAFVGTVVS